MRWGILAFVFAAFVINFADKSIAGYAVVPIMKEFHLNFTQWGLVGSSFFWLFAIAGVLGGALSDRFGTKKSLAFMALVWSVLQFGAYAITGLTGLILMRILLGIFEGPYFAVASNQLSKWFDPERRGLVIAIMNSGGTIGAFVLAPVLVKMISNLGWRNAFAILGISSLIWFVLWLWLGKDSPKESITPIQTKTLTPKPKWIEIYPVLLSPTFILTCLAAFASYWYLAWAQAFMPAYLTQAIHLTPKKMGYFSSIIGVSSGVLTMLIAWFSDCLFKKNQNFRKSRVFIGGASVLAAGLLFSTLTVFHSPTWVLLALSLGNGLAYTMFVLLPPIVSRLMPERGGLMVGVSAGFAQLAGIIGPIVSGVIIQSSRDNVVAGFGNTILFISLLLIILGGAFFIFAKPDKGLAPLASNPKKISL